MIGGKHNGHVGADNLGLLEPVRVRGSGRPCLDHLNDRLGAVVLAFGGLDL